MSFSFTDAGLTTQGQLSSDYTNALSAYLQGEGADVVAFLAYVGFELTVEEALAVKAEIEAGNFSLSGLFSAAQSKTGEVDGGTMTDPTPTLTVGEYVIPLTPMLSGTDTFTWTSGGKTVVYHTREFFTGSQVPDGYDVDWANLEVVNQAPSAAYFDEAVTEFDIKTGAPVDGNNLFEVDLLQNAVDPDGDILNVVADTLTVKLNGQEINSAAFTLDGNKLVVDTNSIYFNQLFKDQKWTFDVSYDITDGVNTVASSGTVEVTGTADQFQLPGTFSGGQTSGFNTTTWDGTFNVVIPTSSLEDGADAYLDFAGNVTVYASGDLAGSTEYVNFTVEGGSGTLTVGGDGSNDFGFEPGNPNYQVTTDSANGSFASADNTVSISYDSNNPTTGSANAGVDSLTSVSAELSNVTYWA